MQNMISREGQWELYERAVIPTVVYGSKMWSSSAQERRKTKVFEIKCLWNICDIRRMDRVKNAIRERCRCELSAVERTERNVLK